VKHTVKKKMSDHRDWD